MQWTVTKNAYYSQLRGILYLSINVSENQCMLYLEKCFIIIHVLLLSSNDTDHHLIRFVLLKYFIWLGLTGLHFNPGFCWWDSLFIFFFFVIFNALYTSNFSSEARSAQVLITAYFWKLSRQFQNLAKIFSSSMQTSVPHCVMVENLVSLSLNYVICLCSGLPRVLCFLVL